VESESTNLNGGNDADILIAGASTLQYDLPSLTAILGRWSAGGNVFRPGSTRFERVVPILNATTLTGDSDNDTLTGGDGTADGSLDVFFMSASDTLGTPADPGEQTFAG